MVGKLEVQDLCHDLQLRFANINQYWNAYLSDYDDLVGAKVTRRRTLEKYLSSNPPIEFNKEVFYIERKVSETPIMVEFELSSAFDVQGIKLPRRTIMAARCPWKYKDTAQGGCNWPVDSRPDSSLVAGSTDYARYTLIKTTLVFQQKLVLKVILIVRVLVLLHGVDKILLQRTQVEMVFIEMI